MRICKKKIDGTNLCISNCPFCGDISNMSLFQGVLTHAARFYAPEYKRSIESNCIFSAISVDYGDWEIFCKVMRKAKKIESPYRPIG